MTIIDTEDGGRPVFQTAPQIGDVATRNPAERPCAGDTWRRPDGRERRVRSVEARIVALEDLDGHLMGRLSLPEFSARVAGWEFVSAAPTGSGKAPA